MCVGVGMGVFLRGCGRGASWPKELSIQKLSWVTPSSVLEGNLS